MHGVLLSSRGVSSQGAAWLLWLIQGCGARFKRHIKVIRGTCDVHRNAPVVDLFCDNDFSDACMAAGFPRMAVSLRVFGEAYMAMNMRHMSLQGRLLALHHRSLLCSIVLSPWTLHGGKAFPPTVLGQGTKGLLAMWYNGDATAHLAVHMALLDLELVPECLPLTMTANGAEPTVSSAPWITSPLRIVCQELFPVETDATINAYAAYTVRPEDVAAVGATEVGAPPVAPTAPASMTAEATTEATTTTYGTEGTPLGAAVLTETAAGEFGGTEAAPLAAAPASPDEAATPATQAGRMVQGLFMVPSIMWLNTRSFSTDVLENFFGRVSQILHGKPIMAEVVRMLAQLEYLSHIGAISDESRGFFYPAAAAHKRRYDMVTMMAWCSGLADKEGSEQLNLYKAQQQKAAYRIQNKFKPVRSFY